MRKIITTTMVTLDGVLQAPGGPEEDPTNGFKWGGWSFNYWDDVMGEIMDKFMSKPFDLLLGRCTYDIFAAHWPFIKDDPVADKFNKIHKYVVSHNKITLTWDNSVLITGDVVGEIKNLKQQDGSDLWVHGSGNLIQTLLANQLVDELYMWTFPITIGKGKRLFAEGTLPYSMELVDSKASKTGVIISHYKPAGELKTGSFALEEPTDAKIALRKKLEEEK